MRPLRVQGLISLLFAGRDKSKNLQDTQSCESLRKLHFTHRDVIHFSRRTRSQQHYEHFTFGLQTLEAEVKRKYKELSKIILPTNFADKFTVCFNPFEKNWNGGVSRFR